MEQAPAAMQAKHEEKEEKVRGGIGVPRLPPTRARQPHPQSHPRGGARRSPEGPGRTSPRAPRVGRVPGRSGSRRSGPARVLASRAAGGGGGGRDGLGGQRHGGGARVGADPAEAGRAGVHLPGAVSGPGGRAEPGLGHGRPPVLPVPVGVLPETRQPGHLALRVHARQR